MYLLAVFLFLSLNYVNINSQNNLPVVLTTWNFHDASERAWQVLEGGGSALDAVEEGASVCEVLQCDGTVGYGGSPDENSETTLDALIIDGKTMNVGAVGALRRIRNAISVARHVLEHTRHSFLVGELATQFALQMGFQEHSLITNSSKNMWKEWRRNNCQPNFWMGVTPDSTTSCGPYRPAAPQSEDQYRPMQVDRYNHDTIGMVAVDSRGDVAAGTSTNGARHKIPGRIGDSPIPGSGAYADNDVGGASATGDGDIMLRFLPSFLTVEEMRRGTEPSEAARIAISRVAKYYPQFMGAVIALRKDGAHGAACHGINSFPYVLYNTSTGRSELITITC